MEPDHPSDDRPVVEPEQESEGFLRLERLSKFFGAHQVIQDLSLVVEAGEILALLGPSGSGKTTILRLLAGFEAPDLGRIVVAEEDVTTLVPARRGFGMVFQNYALFPHMTVGRNIAFGLQAAGLARDAVTSRVSAMLALVDLRGFEDRKVGEISGGQQQRVALARALAPEPRILMLDEPLSNLDPALRERTRRELRKAIKNVGITTLLVTHEQEEAFELGDRVGVLNAGRLDQVGTAEELYENPATVFVATFIGRAAVLQGILEEVLGERSRVRLLGEGSEVGIADWWARTNPELERGEAVDLVVRPDSLGLGRAQDHGAVAGRVVGRRYTGSANYFAVLLDLGVEVEVIAPAEAVRLDEPVHVVPRRDGLESRIFARERADLS